MSDFQIPILAPLVGFLAELMRYALQFCYETSSAFGLPSYGLAIIVMTILIKILLLPLAIKQIRSMRSLQAIQPKIQEIQKKYKGDRAKITLEMQKLYKENEVSPLAGCLPLLIQMPFLVSIYYALQGFPYEAEHESFLWLDSLATPDSLYILPVLSALSTWIISWQTSPKNVQGTQKTMLYVMPLFIGYISMSFPSGLVIYWVVCNLFQLVQQTLMFRKEDRAAMTPDRKGVVTIHNPRPAEKKTVKKVVVKKTAKEDTEKKEKDAEKKAKAEADRKARAGARKAEKKARAKARAKAEAEAAEAAPETAETAAAATKDVPEAETPKGAAEAAPAAPETDAPKAPETEAAAAPERKAETTPEANPVPQEDSAEKASETAQAPESAGHTAPEDKGEKQ